MHELRHLRGCRFTHDDVAFLQGVANVLAGAIQREQAEAELARLAAIVRSTEDAVIGLDPQGIIKTAEIHDNGIGRDAKELLRKVKAAQYVAKNPGQVCPAKWQEGAKTIAPSLDLVGKI